MSELTIYNKIYIYLISIIIPISYIYYIKKYNKYGINGEKLWGKMEGILKKLNIISIYIITISYLILLLYITKIKKIENKNKILLLVGITGFIISSYFWMPLTYEYMLGKQNNKKYIYTTLGFVPLFALIILIGVINNKIESKTLYNITIVSVIYMLLHTLIFDFIIWNRNFF